MAKKQGVSYGPNSALIQGAATAYKNYDNAPGMYAGLDKAIKAGTDTMNTAVENKRVADAKALKKKEEEEKRAKELNNAFYEMSAPIHEAAGGFDEVTGKYASVAAKLEELQPRYIDVMKNGTATEKASVQKEYNNIKNDVSLNVEYRASVADPKNGISVAAMGIGDGRDLEFVTKYLDSNVKADPKPNEKGEETYTIDINGTPMTKTFAEINAMTIFSDQKVFNNVLDATTKLGNSLKGAELNEYTRQNFETKIRSMLPDEENAMLAFMNDKGFGDEGFIDLISKSNNRADIEEEIMSMEEFNSGGDGISQPEWENFTKAMTNPYHKTWEKADGTHDKKAWFEMSQRIVTEQMANGAENQHTLNNPEDPKWKKEGYANKGAYLKATGNLDDSEITDKNPYGLSLGKKGKYGLGFPSPGTIYSAQYDVGYVTNKIENLKSGTEIAFQGGNYTFREVDGITQWWENYGYAEDGVTKVDGVGKGNPIGTAKDMAKEVFSVDDPIFTSIVTEREQEVPDDVTGLKPSENPFADKQATAEGQPKPKAVPNDFVTAFGKLTGSDNAVVKYLKGMNVSGLEVGNYQGGGDLDYPNDNNRKLVEPISGYDDIIVTLNGKTKLFTTDPSFSDDTEGAQEIWNWLHENFSGENVKSSNYSGSAADIVAEIN